MKIKLKQLKVVNDTAERGVALMSKFNKLITNDEEQKQYLLRVISAHRQKYTTTVKNLNFLTDVPCILIYFSELIVCFLMEKL